MYTLTYIDSSKDNKLYIAAVYKIGKRNRIKYTVNQNLGPYRNYRRRALYSLQSPRIPKVIKTKREMGLRQESSELL